MSSARTVRCLLGGMVNCATSFMIFVTPTTGGFVVLSAGNTAQLVVNYISAIGTIGAVLLALFLNVIRERLRRPRLTVSKPSTEHGDLVWFEGEPLKPGSERKEYYECYLRLRVHATAKKDTATSTRALLWKVERPERDPRLEVPDYLLNGRAPASTKPLRSHLACSADSTCWASAPSIRIPLGR